jgi:hypothetical protein
MPDDSQMNANTTKLVPYWFREAKARVGEVAPEPRAGEVVTPSQQQDLDALVNRVAAARSVY